ncbi:carbohydrate ABC transporter permease [Oceanithermus profundus]|uniref:Binding-protein-dependent transport systems inner membrane component n=1 Tax=Oceanithermus profundus (strain DSM 14977 / NBRC 100410 / VKM B-2274 / 506) TaxID=670487 RepID=E4U6C2_OCEP5|nr:sugar ABC transporter permease [Oceanithermus profundus]ADR35542.1 binding-protein-dependent transport systems inner membrane component [Oceanithermus profundus DSM 14977]
MIEERFPGHPYLPYLLVLPSLAVIVVFLIYPFAQSVWGSFFITSFFGDKKLFVGLENYLELFRSPDYLQSVVVTLYFSAFVVVLGLAASLGIALLLNQRIGGLGIYQIALVWTYSISPAVAGVIWALLFAPATGLIPWLVGLVAPGYTLNWMTNGSLALLVVSLAATWKMLGYNIVFFLAGLQNIPEELIDAARVDGAGPWLSFRYITLPMLSPTTTFLLFMNMLYAFFQVFGLIDIMTQGGPGDATNLLVYNLYRDAFIHLNSGRANAQSVIIFVVIAVAAMVQLRAATKKAVYAR